MSKGFYTQDEIAQLCQAIENSSGIPYLTAEGNLMPTYEHPGFMSINYENEVEILATPYLRVGVDHEGNTQILDPNEDSENKTPLAQSFTAIPIEIAFDGQVFALPPFPVPLTFEDIEKDAQSYLDSMATVMPKLAKIATVIMNSENISDEDVLKLFSDNDSVEALFSDDIGLYKTGIRRTTLMDFIKDHVEHFNAVPTEYETPSGLVYSTDQYLKVFDADEKEDIFSQISRPH